MKKLSLITLAVCGIGSAQAEIIKIPSQSGFSGFVLGGVSAMEYESNFFKGPNDDNERHNGLSNSPESHTAMMPLFGGDLRYTFADTRTQIFFGNLIQDALRFDFAQQFGVRQQLGDKGILGVSYVFSLLDSKGWEDPYASGKRRETDMKSSGARLAWDQIWGSHFNTSITVRNVDVDKELSGQSFDLKKSQRDTLDRNGSSTKATLSYDWVMAPGHILTPEFAFVQGDFDGDAVSYDNSVLQLSYAYVGSQWSLTSNVFAGASNFDAENPIYNKKADANEFGINTTFIWHKLFGINKLNGTISAGYAKNDSDINFYDSKVSSISTGLLYQL